MSHVRSSFASIYLQVFRIWILAVGSVVISALLCGQETAILSGGVVTEKQAGIIDAQVVLTDTLHHTERQVLTDPHGLFVLDLLTPGDYSLAVSKAGFTSFRMEHVELPTRGRRSLQIVLTAAATPATTENETAPTKGFDADGSAALYLDSDFFLPLPLVNRNVAQLVALTPGIVVPQNPGDRPEVFDANGLRPNSNYFVVDGVADTTPIAGDLSTPFGQVGVPGGSAPAAAANSAFLFLPLDALQDVTIQPLAFPPDVGRTPGAQVAMTTRSGTDLFHGSLYGYARVTSLNANDYFANLAGLRRPSSTQNRFGATFGGPLGGDQPRTFFFLWYEGLNAETPQTLYNIVPDAATRASASPQFVPYLNAFPAANRAELTQGAALFAGAISDPLHSKNGGIRLDRQLSERWRGFLRYGYSDWNGYFRGTEQTAANVVTRQDAASQTLTAGFLYLGANAKTTDIRVNYSVDRVSSSSNMDTFGGATPLPPSLVFPTNIVGGSGSFDLSVLGATGYTLNGYRKVSDQRFDVEDANAIILGTHEYKIGVDVRRIASTYYNLPYSSNFIFNGIASTLNGGLLSGQAVNSIINASVPKVYPTFLQIGTYLQDTWKASSSFTITYGARYDINPAPRARTGLKPYGINGSGFLTTTLPIYNTQWTNISPRIGMAYQIDQTPGKELSVRGGFGLYYDTSFASTNSAFFSAPYESSGLLTNPAFPASPSTLRAPALGTKPYGVVYGAATDLKAPRIYEYRVELDRNFGRNQTVSLSYLASRSSNITQNQTTPAFSAQYDLANQIANVGTSNYKAAQLEFRRTFTRSLNVQASYTWSHAVDTASTDTALGGAFVNLFGNETGDASFDVRHQVKASGSFEFPSAPAPLLNALTRDWFLDFNGIYRSSLPFNILALSNVTSVTLNNCTANSNTYCTVGVYSEVRPNQVSKQAWLSTPGVPGGRTLQAAAFSAPATFSQGDLGRNALHGYSASEFDLALRRRIAIGDRFSVTLRAEAFNILNHPAFANPLPFVTGNLSSPSFGLITQSLSSGFGGLPAYGLGMPRTLQFAIRLQF